MNSKVKIVADQKGNVIIPSKNNPEWGSVRVAQDVVVMENGFRKRKTRYAFMHDTIANFKSDGLTAGLELDGKVVIRESLTPFNSENPDADLKIAGETGVVLSHYGSPIYRKMFYETNPSKFEDCTVEHTNGEEVKAAYEKLKEAKAATAGDLQP